MHNLRRSLLVGVIIILVLLGAAGLGYLYWYQPSYDYFSTNDASVTGTFVRVAAPASGQVYDVLADVGTSVKKGDTLATIQVTAASRLLTYVTSPTGGTIATRNVNVGETIAAGTSMGSIVDLSQLWVVVNVDETRLAAVRVGQTADVAIAAVNQTFHGKVTEVGAATTNVLSPSISLTSSSDTTQKVPVKIVFDYTGARLVPGMSATVTIHTRETPQ